MRRLIIISVIIIFILMISFFVYGIARKAKEQVIIEGQISKLPSFSFTTLQNTKFDSQTITEGPVLIVRFHPECEHCQHEISELLNSTVSGSGVKILLISGAERNMVIRFLDQFNLAEKPEVITLLDTAYVFGEIFGKDLVPSNYIYNEELELVKILAGEYKIETILKYLAEGE
jgi:hypothetical protein